MAEYTVPNKLNHFISSQFSVWFEKLNDGGTYDDPLPLGNVTDTTLSLTINKLEHKTNQYGLDAKDLTIPIERGGTLKLTIDELVRKNLEMVLGSTTRQTAQTVNVPKQVKQAFAAGTLTLAEHPIVSVIAVRPLSGEEVWEEGPTADYEVTEATGVISLPVGSQIGSTETVWIDYYVAVSANKYTILGDMDVEGKLTVVKLGTTAGPKRAIVIPSVRVFVDGDIALNPKTEFETASLSFELQEDPTDGFGYVYQW